MDAQKRAEALKAVERATELPMLLLSLALIPLLIGPLIVTVPDTIEPALEAVGWLIWAAFATELVVKTYLSERRAKYLAEHWFDVLIVTVPLLRPLRIAQSMRVLRLLRLVRIASLGVKAVTTTRGILSHHGLQYVLALTVGLVVAAAALVSYFERDAGGSISDFPTALWWAVTTVTTVGYGDTYPVTPEGRGVGVFVMLAGITVFGLLTANVAAFFVESDRGEEVTLRHLMTKLDELQARIDEVQRQLATPGRVSGEGPAAGEHR